MNIADIFTRQKRNWKHDKSNLPFHMHFSVIISNLSILPFRISQFNYSDRLVHLFIDWFWKILTEFNWISDFVVFLSLLQSLKLYLLVANHIEYLVLIEIINGPYWFFKGIEKHLKYGFELFNILEILHYYCYIESFENVICDIIYSNTIDFRQDFFVKILFFAVISKKKLLRVTILKSPNAWIVFGMHSNEIWRSEDCF